MDIVAAGAPGAPYLAPASAGGTASAHVSVSSTPMLYGEVGGAGGPPAMGGGAGGFSGGGSSYAPGGATGVARRDAAPSVSISYTVPARSGRADVQVALSAAPSPVHFLGLLAYMATVTNRGPSAAGAVTFTDTLPRGVRSLVLLPPAGWSCHSPRVLCSGTITCITSTLVPRASVTFRFAVIVVARRGSSLRDGAKVSSATADPRPANNQAVITTRVV